MSGMMGLHIGISALKAQQRALDVTGHNIANANTEGYSRQRAELITTRPYTMPGFNDRKQAGQVGTGVQVGQIVRLREAFIDERLRDTSSSLGEWEQRSKTLREIESIFAEPTEDGLRGALDKFWKALQELHNNPENGAVRAAVRESGAALTDVFSSMRVQLDEYQSALDTSVVNKVTEINTLAQRIADLNSVISQVESKGENPNDLMDERDLLIDKLSKITNIEVSYDSRNRANITIAGYSLVATDKYSSLEAKADYRINGLVSVRWVGSGQKAEFQSGELAGILDSRDRMIIDYATQLDDMARKFMGAFNDAHRKGFGLNNNTNINFFKGTGAADMRISDEINDPTNGLNNIAAALVANSPGDGRSALKLSDVINDKMLSGGSTSMGDYWSGIITEMGIEAQRATRLENSQSTIKHQLEQQKSSVSGVSLDEEMSNLIIYQHGYNAAAKLISTQSEMLDTLVSILK